MACHIFSDTTTCRLLRQKYYIILADKTWYHFHGFSLRKRTSLSDCYTYRYKFSVFSWKIGSTSKLGPSKPL